MADFFNFTSGYTVMHVMHKHKIAKLKIENKPKQVLGSLLVAFHAPS
jgi:hypothetical protein